MRKDFINQQIITSEKEKHEKLLLNILPRSVAEELKTFGKAEVETFKKAKVLFTDFEGFTRFAERWPPKKLIEELNEVVIASCARIDQLEKAQRVLCEQLRQIAPDDLTLSPDE